MGAAQNLLIENLPELLRYKEAAELTGFAIKTIRDWKHRPDRYGIPLHIRKVLFCGRKIRTRVLREWKGI